MHIETLVVGPLATNCYVVSCPKSRAGMIVDPGGEAERIARYVQEARLQVTWIVNTHGHADHIGANAALKEIFRSAKLAIHPADAEMLAEPRLNLSLITGADVRSPAADVLLTESDGVEVGALGFRVIHLPGHTPGGIGLYRDASTGGQGGVVLSGDVLFAGSVGRFDLPGGDPDELIRAIKARLLVLPDPCAVYPGHGPATTVERERIGNPFLQ